MKLSEFKISSIILFMLSMTMFMMSMKFLLQNKIMILEWSMLSCNSTSMIMTLILDWISTLFMSIVLLISSSVMYFSSYYMMEEKFKLRFCLMVILFIISMMLLIISPNTITILLGWDGLGLVSYVLVIYYQNNKSASAGMITALTNRIGDIAILLCISWMLNHGNWNFLSLNSMLNHEMKMWICSFILLAAMTKSAQMPFSAWLPAAMAAPTPVSALVHSSTLVTAGIFILIRFSNYFSEIEWFKSFLLLSASITMFMASTVANNDYDIKKIIALSTLSQLGLMMAIIALGLPKLAFFHLIIHALFKALLFICAGMMIHKFFHFQDIRLMGLVTNHMPVISTCLNTANLALCGIPFMAGYYSKDMILESMTMILSNPLPLLMILVATGMTTAYSLRLMYFSFWFKLNTKSINLNFNTNDLNNGALILILGSIFGGAFLSWMIMDLPTIIFMPFTKKLITMSLITSGIIFNLTMNNNWLFKMKKNKLSKTFNSQMWFSHENSSQSLMMPTFKMSLNSFSMDSNWLEISSAQGLFFITKNMSKMNENIQNNSLKLFLTMIMMPLSILFLMNI